MTVPVFVINRACDGDRLHRFRRAARKQGVTAHRIAAIDGHRVDAPFAAWEAYLGNHFWGEPEIKPGALACYLSHLKAWEAVIASGAGHAMICEDDAELIAPADAIDAAVRSGEGADLIFCNDRLCREGTTSPLPLEQALARMIARAPGADCYLISRRGAEAMIQRTRETRIICGVDWALVWAGLGPDAGDLPQPEVAQLLGFGPVNAPSLTVQVAAEPLASLRSGVPSVLNHDHRMPINALQAGTAHHVHADHAVLVPAGPVQLGFVGRTGRDPVMAAQRDGMLWEAAPIMALLQRFPEGGAFADIGAHVGNHSVALGRLADARIIAVEPNPEIRRLLDINLGLNRLGGVTEVVEHALGAAAGQGALEIRRRRPADSKLSGSAPSEPAPETGEDEEALPAFDGASPNRRIAVEVIAGDDLFDGRALDAIKIDTSGGELDVLKGLRKVLRSQGPDLLLDHRVHEADRIGQFLEKLGYRRIGTWPHEPPRRQVSLFVRDGSE